MMFRRLFILSFILSVAVHLHAASDMKSCGPLTTPTGTVHVAEPWANYPKYVTATSGDINPFGATDRTGTSVSPLTFMTSDLARPDEVIEELPFVAGGNMSLILRSTARQAVGYRETPIFKAPPSTGGTNPENPDIKVETPLGDAPLFLCLLAMLMAMLKWRKREATDKKQLPVK